VEAVTARSKPARYPQHGAWPCEMRADLAAAFLDCSTTAEFYKAIQRGEAPPPTATRVRSGKREPVWALDMCRAHVARRHEIENDASPLKENIGRLV